MNSRERISYVVVTILCQFLFGTAFLTPPSWKASACKAPDLVQQTALFSSSDSEESPEMEKNSIYIKGLMENLSTLCDKYIIGGSEIVRGRLLNVLDRIAAEAFDQELVLQSVRMVKRAAVPFNQDIYVKKADIELGKTDAKQRRQVVETRKDWEAQRTSEVGESVGSNLQGRSALSNRAGSSTKPDVFMSNVMNPTPDSIATIANDKNELQKELDGKGSQEQPTQPVHNENYERAASRVSELIAKAGSGAQFEGESLGIGGLDDVLAQVKRRVWIPLAAPPKLLEELGIHPVRGLLLYGRPGCGKTLLARTLGKILSPMRPITVVSGPEILDKFVGSSEKNLRELFENPPDIYDTYRLGERDGGNSLACAALHVVVMDEFDAVARTRGGRGGKGDQGDAGVARDSVVNQLLAKMDGVHPLPVPTLVIGLTNKRSLIEPALLRPGRFEVQVEVPPPKTNDQRVSILKVHTRNMHEAGRLLVSDPPADTAAARYLKNRLSTPVLSYEQLMNTIAAKCDGFSGAALAGVARAAASHALERAVDEFSRNLNGAMSAPSIMDCLVTMTDFNEAMDDVLQSMGNSDYAEDGEEGVDEGVANDGDSADDPISPE